MNSGIRRGVRRRSDIERKRWKLSLSVSQASLGDARNDENDGRKRLKDEAENVAVIKQHP